MNLSTFSWALLADGGGFSSLIIPIGGMLLIFYFILWRPQARERRERETMLSALKSGDKVITTSGIFGTVFSVKETEVVLKVDEKNNLKLRMSRQAIQSVLRDNAPAENGKSPAST